MGGFWVLNGLELTAASVSIKPTRLTVDRRVHQAKVNQHDGTQYREKVGMALPTLAIDISFLGRGTAKWAQAAYVKQVLEDNEVWTLEAPSLLPVYVFKTEKRAALATDGWTFDAQKATGRIVLNIQATVDGIWAADGGTYCQATHGSFTRIAGGQYRRDSDGVVTGTTPVLRVPRQFTNYPQAVNNVFQRSQPPLLATWTIGGLDYEDYDMSSFLHPAPATEGDVGLYDACLSHDADFLDGPILVAPPPPLDAVFFTGAQQGLLTEGLNVTNT